MSTRELRLPLSGVCHLLLCSHVIVQLGEQTPWDQQVPGSAQAPGRLLGWSVKLVWRWVASSMPPSVSTT